MSENTEQRVTRVKGDPAKMIADFPSEIAVMAIVGVDGDVRVFVDGVIQTMEQFGWAQRKLGVAAGIVGKVGCVGEG